MKINKKKVLFPILLIFLIIISYFVYKFYLTENISINDCKSISEKYLKDLTKRLTVVKYSDNLTNDELIYKLKYIDQMYNEGLIKANENIFYLSSNPCEKKACFSIRETYLFNLNIPIYEG